MSRDAVLSKVRAALGRSAGDAVPAPPALVIPRAEYSRDRRLELFAAALDRLGVHFVRVRSEAQAAVEILERLDGRSAIAAESPLLRACGVPAMPGVLWGVRDPAAWRTACSECGVGITGAAYALAETGALVMIAGPQNPRLGSLLPPAHIAVISESQLLNGLPELLDREPHVFSRSSSLVLVTGTSSTGDIEQLLIKGVHGPGEGHVILVEETAP
jgi:L-lactate dehydrogenase complex protein LldG